MTVRSIPSLLFLALATCLLATCQRATPAERPNLILILTDDQTYTSVAALGNGVIRTPHLDRLVGAGTTFTHAYNMGGWNGAICIASRSMLNSGRSIWRADRFRHEWSDSTASARTWSRLLAGAGYETYLTGKWHVDVAPDDVFDRVGTVRPGMPADAWDHHAMVAAFAAVAAGEASAEDILPVGYNRPRGEDDDSWSPTDERFGGFWENGTHLSEALRGEATGFLERAAGREAPFFMYLAFNAPHDPRQAPERYQAMYPVGELPLPAAFRPVYPDYERVGAGRGLRDEALAPFPRTPLAVRTHLSEYYAMITHLDDQIGLILDALEASGQADNTYLIFTADHGLAVGRHGFLGKQNMYDHSIRVPFVLVGPDIPAGRRVATDIYLQDAMATFLELAGVDPPDYVEFNSLLDLARREGAPGHYPAIYGAYRDRQRMIRKDGYKLIVYPTTATLKLYDLTADPEELNDLAGTQVQRQRLTALFADLQDLQRSFADTLDLANVLPRFLARPATPSR